MIMLDTSFVLAYYNTRDQNHDEAAKMAKGLFSQPLYITNYIFGEIVTVSFFKLKNLGRAKSIGKTVLDSCNLLHLESEEFEDAWKLFSSQKLKLSFVDCTTITAMKSQRIPSIATFDGDFSKVEGIKVVGK